jgi:BA14K-like protein
MMLSSKLFAAALVATSMPLAASAAPLSAPIGVKQAVQSDPAQVEMVQFRRSDGARSGMSGSAGRTFSGSAGRTFSGSAGRTFSGSPRTNFNGGNWSGRDRWAGGNWRRHRGFGRGFGAGVVIGASPYYDYGYDPDAYAYDDGYVAVEPGYDGDSVAYCQQRFRSYDVRSGTYLGYDGLRHPCP